MRPMRVIHWRLWLSAALAALALAIKALSIQP
jgi:hypothetical protein